MKKIILLLFVLVPAFALAACNTQTNETAITNDGSAQENASQPDNQERILEEGETIVSTYSELEAAVNDKEITGIYIGTDIDIASDLSFEREDDLMITIDGGKTLTISGSFNVVACAIVNDGTIVVNGAFQRGIANLTNNGSVMVNNGGTVTSGQSETINQGEFTVADGGNLYIERGSIFNNRGSLINDGYVSINNGGQLNDGGGAITNNGTIDLSSYFNGDITLITGTGTLNDNRE